MLFPVGSLAHVLLFDGFGSAPSILFTYHGLAVAKPGKSQLTISKSKDIKTLDFDPSSHATWRSLLVSRHHPVETGAYLESCRAEQGIEMRFDDGDDAECETEGVPMLPSMW